MSDTRNTAPNADPLVLARFWSKVAVGDPGECWPWQEKSRNEHGYGIFRPTKDSGVVKAHRFAWSTENGPIPAGEVIRHSCDTPPCCNPAHLSNGTQAQNIADMHERGRRVYTRAVREPREPKPPAGRFSHATHCVHGHEFTPENTRLSRNPRVRSGYERVCRTCRREHNRKQAARRKAARALTKEITNGK